MTNTILIKRSATANSIPAAGNLSLGELAINYTDGNLFYKNAGGTVTVIASNKFVSVSGNIDGANLNISDKIYSSNILSTDASVVGNFEAGNIKAVTSLSAIGNIYAGNIYYTAI